MRFLTCLIGLMAVMVLTGLSQARSPEHFRELLDRQDQLSRDTVANADALTKLHDQIDAEALQKEAWKSRLYWYTDFAEAAKIAKTTGKPILSLRLLGNLSDELSCANSRYFRKLLYVDPEVSKLLNERYVLHWESLRPVPIITIDFGDGKTIKRTITGNSLHYVFLPGGELLDVMPGLCDAKTFATELLNAADYAQAGKTEVVDRAAYWKTTILRLATVQPAPRGKERQADAASRVAFVKRAEEEIVLRSTMNPTSNVARDTYINQRQFRPNILRRLLAGQDADVKKLTESIYRDLFLAPLDDPSMGLDPPDVAALLK